MNSLIDTAEAVGFPIRKSPDQSLLSNSPKHIAACHVLHRLLVPRHPPNALSSLLFTPYSLLKKINEQTKRLVAETFKVKRFYLTL